MSDNLAWLRTAPPEQISGRNVTLRRWTDDDLDEQLVAIDESMDALTLWMPWADGYTRDDGVEFLTRMGTAWDTRSEFGYAVVDTEDLILGSVGLHARIGEGGLTIGYWIRSSAQRRGIATRAAALATAAAFEIDGVTHVEIRHDRANELSGRIPRRLGYRHVDTVTDEPEKPTASGISWRWRMAADEFPDSIAARLMADERDGAS